MGTATHGVPAAAPALDQCRSFAAQAAAAADVPPSPAQPAALRAQQLPRDAAQLTGSIDGILPGSHSSPFRTRKLGEWHTRLLKRGFLFQLAAILYKATAHDAVPVKQCDVYYVASAGLLRNTEVPLRNWAGDVVGHTTLPGAVFDVDVRRDILHRVVRWQLAKRQQVTPPSSSIVLRCT